MARKLNIKLFIEDQLTNANTLAQVCERVFLVNRTYNQGRVPPAVQRVSSVKEAVSLLIANGLAKPKTKKNVAVVQKLA